MSKESLKDKAVVISGVFEKFSRKELKDIIDKAGGKASSSISKNTSFVLAGDKMGPSKKEKAEELNIEIISEVEFINRFLDSSENSEERFNITELGLEQITYADLLGLYNENDIADIKKEIASSGSYDDDVFEFYKDDESGNIDVTLMMGSFEIIDHINSMKICENDPYIMIVKDSWSGENEEGEEVGRQPSKERERGAGAAEDVPEVEEEARSLQHRHQSTDSESQKSQAGRPQGREAGASGGSELQHDRGHGTGFCEDGHPAREDDDSHGEAARAAEQGGGAATRERERQDQEAREARRERGHERRQPGRGAEGAQEGRGRGRGRRRRAREGDHHDLRRDDDGLRSALGCTGFRARHVLSRALL